MDTIALVINYSFKLLQFAINYLTCACIEIDECTTAPSPCEHNCSNTVGSFQCSCISGYLLDDDGRSCDGTHLHVYTVKENNEFFYFS